MKYLINLILTALAYHFILCSMASFTIWEPVYFNVEEWGNRYRGLYLIGFLFCCAGILIETNDRIVKATKGD